MNRTISKNYTLLLCQYLTVLLVALSLTGCFHENVEDSAELSNLTLSAGALTPAFDSTTFIYAMRVDYSVRSTTVTASVANSNFDILLINSVRESSGQASHDISLDVGDNEINIQVINENGTSENYLVVVSRGEASTNSNLVDIVSTEGNLTPTFNAGIKQYTILVNNSIASLQITASSEDENSQVKLNGTVLLSGTISEEVTLTVGDNTFNLLVTAQDGITTSLYTLIVTRERLLSNDSSLNGISVSAGTLSPAFSSTISNYSVNVESSTESINVVASSTDSNASIKVNGELIASGASHNTSLVEGENTITIISTAEDTVTTNTTTIEVHRASAAVNFAQEAYIKSSENTEFDRFSHAIAASENTLVVGTPYDDINGDKYEDSGAVYVFTRNNEGIWSQQAKLKSMYSNIRDYFGYSVDIDGDTIVVGAYFEDSNAVGVDGEQNNNSGLNTGAVFVFTRTGTEWTQTAFLKASNPGNEDFFGISVAVDGETIAVGSPREDGASSGVNNAQNNNLENSGATYLFSYQNSAWTQTAYIKPSNPDVSDGFGKKVALYHDTLAVSSNDDSASTGVNGDQTDNSADVAGAVYVFTQSAGQWAQQAYIKASNTEAGDIFGAAIALGTNSLVVGATGESSSYTGVDAEQSDNNAESSGAVYVFSRSNNVWQQDAYIKASNTDSSDRFGNTVTIDGSVILVGSSNESSTATGINGDSLDNDAVSSGAAYLLIKNASVWSEQVYIKASNAQTEDSFGYGVAIGAGFVAIGSRNESSNATGVGGEQNNEDGAGSGAVYTFSGVLLNNND